jgi:hypothetical protein
MSLARRGLAGVAAARVRFLAISAAACGMLTLGLQWGAAYDDVYLPGAYRPGWCANVLGPDGSWMTECAQSTWDFGITWYGSDGAVGAQTVARVFVVAAAIAATVALRRSSRRWAVVAVLVVSAGLLLGGLGARPGQLAYIAGGLLLAVALRTAGLLVMPRGVTAAAPG